MTDTAPSEKPFSEIEFAFWSEAWNNQKPRLWSAMGSFSLLTIGVQACQIIFGTDATERERVENIRWDYVWIQGDCTQGTFTEIYSRRKSSFSAITIRKNGEFGSIKAELKKGTITSRLYLKIHYKDQR